MIEMTLMEELIKMYTENGGLIEVDIEKDKSVSYIFRGFYKSGEAKLVTIDDKIIAKSRYDQEDVIESWNDLAQLNYDWWIKSRDKFDGWKSPESPFIDYFEEKGWIKGVKSVEYEPIMSEKQ